MESFFLDCDSWITLRQRQVEFHSRLAMGKLVISEVSENLAVKGLQLSKLFQNLKQYSLNLFEILCGIFYCPKLLLKICLTSRSPNRVGLYRKSGDSTVSTKNVSWSKQLPTHFLAEIASKLESAEAESVIFLAAVSLALKDYYQEVSKK